MAFLPALTRGAKSSGIARSASIQVSARGTVAVRVNAPLATGEDLLLFGLERSADGVTWTHLVSTVTQGGARVQRDGSLPFVKVGVLGGIQVRAFCILPAGMEFGLEVEVL